MDATLSDPITLVLTFPHGGLKLAVPKSRRSRPLAPIFMHQHIEQQPTAFDAYFLACLVFPYEVLEAEIEVRRSFRVFCLVIHIYAPPPPARRYSAY